MGKNVSTNRLAAIGSSKEGACTRVTLDLVCLGKKKSVIWSEKVKMERKNNHQNTDVEFCK